jgi:hypothetical protein
MQKTLSLLTVAVGLVLMAYMVFAESEPGAIPLLLIVLGSGWYIFTRLKARSPN